jgi:hypothetical protein
MLLNYKMNHPVKEAVALYRQKCTGETEHVEAHGPLSAK